jgi:hypothetical protein
MAELIARMTVMLEPLQARGDQRQFFHATYLRTTIAVARDIERGGFIDADWVEKWDIAFAGLYLDALEASLAGQPTMIARREADHRAIDHALASRVGAE